MGLFDLFSGQDDAEAAAAKNAALYNQYGIDTSNLYNQYKTGATGALTGAADTAVGTLGTGLTNTLGALNTGLTGSLAAGNAGVAAYNPLSKLGENYGTAVNRYYDTLGLNGPGAAQAAQAQYVADPGQQYQIDQATQAAINAASRTGSVGGGSTAQGIGRDVLGIVNTNYKNYQDRLAGFVNPQLQATTAAAQGISGANKTLADIYNQGYGAYRRGLRSKRHRRRLASRVASAPTSPTCWATIRRARDRRSRTSRRATRRAISRRPGRPDRRLEPVGSARRRRQGGGRGLWWRQAARRR